jgi:hypothetical protein
MIYGDNLLTMQALLAGEFSNWNAFNEKET